MKLKKEGLAQSLKILSSAHTGNKFTGILCNKDSLDFFIQGDNIISILRIPGKADLPNGMVDSEALQAAVAQVKGEYIDIDAEETDVSTLVIGNATLAMRDAPELTDLDLKLTELPELIVDLIADRLPETFITVAPKTVFGWELQVNNKVARYGSTNGAQAVYEESDLDHADYHLTIPHETCMLICKIVGSATSIRRNARLLAVAQGDITHYVPIMEDAAKITLKDMQALIDNKNVEFCLEAVNLSEPLTQLLSFADKDSQLLFTMESGVLQGRVTSKVGSNIAKLAHFARKDKVNFSCTLRQVMTLAKYDVRGLRLGVGFRDKAPFVLHAEFDGEHKRKGKPTRKFSHFYLASTSGR